MNEAFQIDGARVTLFPGAPTWEGAPTMALGEFACETAGAGAAVLTEAEAAARARGAERLLGPMNGTTWNTYRLVIESDGSEPFLMEPTSGPEDRAAFEAAGFAPIATYFSARGRLDEMDRTPPIASGIKVAPWDGTDPERHFSQVYDLSLHAFARNAFFTPITRQAFLDQYMPFVPMLRPEFVLFARDDTRSLVGFLFGIPNYNEGPKPGTAILKSYASLKHGAGQALAAIFHDNARTAGFTTAIHALMHETNVSAERSARLGARPFRRYALMGKVLDDNSA